MQCTASAIAACCIRHRSALRWALHRTAFFIRPCSHPHPIAPGDSSHPFPNRHLPPDSGRPTSARTSPKHIQKFASPSGIQAKAGKQTSNHEAIHCTMQRLEQEEKGEQSCMLLLMQRGKAKDALRCMHHRSALRWALHRTAFFIRPYCHYRVHRLHKDIRPAGIPPLKSLRTPGKILAETGKDIVFTHPEP